MKIAYVYNTDLFTFLNYHLNRDISANPLICNCELWWLRESSIKLTPIPKCDSATMNGRNIEKLQNLQEECDWVDKVVYLLDIIPNHDQV